MSECTIESIGLGDVLPDSIASDETIVATVKAMHDQLAGIVAERIQPALFYRISELDSTQLDHVAVMFDITTWRDTWSVETKRSVLKMIFQTKCRMGTLSAVRTALASLGAAATLTEWWESDPKGDLHTFTIDVTVSSTSGVTTELQEDIFGLLDEAKPARSLYTFNLRAAQQGGFGFTGAARVLAFRRLKNF